MIEGKYLITTDNWFVAPDGKQYRAVYGNCEIMEDSFLGIKINSKSSNWFVKVGTEEQHVILAGCQIHYAAKCDSVEDGDVEDWTNSNGKAEVFTRPTKIYIP